MTDQPTTFAELTAVTPTDDPDRFTVDVHPSSWIVRGPNGGYLAALVVRAVEARLAALPGAADGPVRSPRSITLHYPRGLEAGPAEISTRIVRVGRSLATVAAEITQGGDVAVTSLVACSPPWKGPSWADDPMPEVPTRDELPEIERAMPLPYMAYWDQRHCLGPGLFGEADQALTGGWLGIRDTASPLDAAAVAAMSDAWPPAVFARTGEPMGAPTVDLTIHLRRAFPTPELGPGDAALVRFRTLVAEDGFFEEDGMVWAPDGTVLAHSRQLALLL